MHRLVEQPSQGPKQKSLAAGNSLYPGAKKRLLIRQNINKIVFDSIVIAKITFQLKSGTFLKIISCLYINNRWMVLEMLYE